VTEKNTQCFRSGNTCVLKGKALELVKLLLTSKLVGADYIDKDCSTVERVSTGFSLYRKLNSGRKRLLNELMRDNQEAFQCDTTAFLDVIWLLRWAVQYE